VKLLNTHTVYLAKYVSRYRYKLTLWRARVLQSRIFPKTYSKCGFEVRICKCEGDEARNALLWLCNVFETMFDKCCETRSIFVKYTTYNYVVQGDEMQNWLIL